MLDLRVLGQFFTLTCTFSRCRNTVSFNIEWAMAMDDTLVNLFKLHDVLIN